MFEIRLFSMRTDAAGCNRKIAADEPRTDARNTGRNGFQACWIYRNSDTGSSFGDVGRGRTKYSNEYYAIKLPK